MDLATRSLLTAWRPALGILFIGLVFSQCGSESHHEHHKHEHDLEQHTAEPDETGKIQVQPSGQKYELDSSTRHAFRKIESTIQHANRQNLQSLIATGQTLEAQKNELIQGCSMTGEQHNQLHRFLSKFNPLIAQLTNASSLNEAQASMGALDEMVALFWRTFK